MMTYEKPKLTMICDDTEVLGKVPNELYYWEMDSFDTVRMGSLHAEPRLDGEGGCPGVFDFGERWDPIEKPADYTWEFRLDPL